MKLNTYVKITGQKSKKNITLHNTLLKFHRALYDIKKMFGYTRRDSMTGVFLELSLPTLDTIVHNSRVLFANQCQRSCKQIVQWFNYTCIVVFISLLYFYFL